VKRCESPGGHRQSPYGHRNAPALGPEGVAPPFRCLPTGRPACPLQEGTGMQLCECCKKLDTCQLEKRRPDRRPPEVQQKHDPQINLQYSLSPCDAFELVCRFSQDRYERIKKLVHRARAAAKASSSRETIHLDIPLEIGTEDYHHSDVLEAFLNVDFDAESEYESFITHYVGPHFPRQVSNLLDLRDRMKQAQDKLRPLFEGKSDPNNR